MEQSFLTRSISCL